MQFEEQTEVPELDALTEETLETPVALLDGEEETEENEEESEEEVAAEIAESEEESEENEG